MVDFKVVYKQRLKENVSIRLKGIIVFI